jgi:hypothetical protein
VWEVRAWLFSKQYGSIPVVVKRSDEKIHSYYKREVFNYCSEEVGE